MKVQKLFQEFEYDEEKYEIAKKEFDIKYKEKYAELKKRYKDIPTDELLYKAQNAHKVISIGKEIKNNRSELLHVILSGEIGNGPSKTRFIKVRKKEEK